MSLRSLKLLTLFKLNASRNEADGWKQQFKVEASAFVCNKETRSQHLHGFVCGVILFVFLDWFLWHFAFTFLSLLSNEMKSQPCYFNPPFLWLHILTQEIKPLWRSTVKEIKFACVKLLLFYRTACKCVKKLINFSLNKTKCIQVFDSSETQLSQSQNASILRIIMVTFWCWTGTTFTVSTSC